MFNFLSQNIEIKEEISPGGSVIVKFPFEGDASEIVSWQTHCGCTADVRVENNSLVATYTDKDAIKIDKTFYKTHYPKGTIPYKKGITVFLKDEESLHIVNGMNKEYNPKKKHVDLYFSGHVRLF